MSLLIDSHLEIVDISSEFNVVAIDISIYDLVVMDQLFPH